MIHGFFSYREFYSGAKDRAPSTFQLQPIIITQGHDSSVLLYLAMVSIYPNATLNKQHLIDVPRHKQMDQIL